MRDTVSDEEVARYRRDGFVVLGGLLDGAALRRWREVFEAAAAGRRSRLPLGDEEYGEFYSSVEEYYDRVFTQRMNCWMTSEAARTLVLDERLGRLAADLAGVDGVRLWLDQVLVKEPYANPTAFHLDVPYWSFSSDDALTFWIALSDATLQNGCMCYLPGSHLLRRYDNIQIGREIGSLFDVYPEWREVEPTPCPVRAGDAVVHNGLTAHGAGANMTPRRRFAVTVAFMPDGSRFNGQQDMLPGSYVQTLAVGDVLDDDRYNPLVFSRRRPAP